MKCILTVISTGQLLIDVADISKPAVLLNTT